MKNNKIKLIPREYYSNLLIKFMDRNIIKVLIGMRRSGKSSIMKLIINDLIKQNIPTDNTVYINKESLEFEEIITYKDLYNYVVKKLKSKTGSKYIFIDEVQEIAEWEKAVISFYSENIGDIIISGSNSRLLSSELSTLLSGRYVELPVYPLTFKEFLKFRGDNLNIDDEFNNYLKYGGLPGIHQLIFEEEIIFNYLNSILNTILYKDILIKYKIRDAALFDKVITYLFDNIGNITTAKKIADFFKSQNIKVSVDTILNYFRYIESTFIMDRIPRFDIKGKKLLEFYDKIFLNDIGLRNGLIGYKEKDINQILENIVYHHLKAMGYKVYIGKLNGFEIDFVVQKQNETKYIQVAYLLTDEKTVKREFGNLEKIKDNYEKIVISLDKFFSQEIRGIKHIYLIDFLRF